MLLLTGPLKRGPETTERQSRKICQIASPCPRSIWRRLQLRDVQVFSTGYPETQKLGLHSIQSTTSVFHFQRNASYLTPECLNQRPNLENTPWSLLPEMSLTMVRTRRWNNLPAQLVIRETPWQVPDGETEGGSGRLPPTPPPQNVPFFFFFGRECAILTCGLFWVKGTWDPVAQENFPPSPNQTEGSKFGVFPGIRVINKDKFYLSDPFVRQGKHVIITHTLLSLCELPSLPRSPTPPAPFSLLQDDLCYFAGLWNSHGYVDSVSVVY